MEDEIEPRIIAFLCQWCGYQGADMAGTSRLKTQLNRENVVLSFD